MEYASKMREDSFESLNGRLKRKKWRKLLRVWDERIKEDYEKTKESNTSLGRFLKKYPLSFKEFKCFLELLDDDYDVWEDSDLDVFRKHRVRYESSQMKRYKLVFKIVNPLKPLKCDYVVSYKAQLQLENKRYSEEYQQLDVSFEEEAKRNSPDSLDSLYYVSKPKTNFNDFIADSELKEKLLTAKARAQNHQKIFKNWGLGKVIQYGRGTTLNFRGPPGTGKTLAANCFAKELGKKLLVFRYDQMQDKYIGETEKHIQRVFKIAKTKDAVLFFDEADAIANDRKYMKKGWELSQVNTLLKELERFEGVCIFATNFAEKYDPAFERRLTMHVDFKMPTPEQNLKIFGKLFPKQARPKNFSFEGLDLSNLSGGDIKNIMLNAAGIAAKEKTEKIKIDHLKEAIKAVKSEKIVEKKNMRYIA
jgi:SpoVK/Ycf46/Vps4 family AAA+-type ATPase